MVKSQPERVFIVANLLSPNGNKKTFPESDEPPKIPPRMKKKGPALPEKPPHMRVSPIPASHQPLREPLRPRLLPLTNMDGMQATQREVLVAASRGAVQRPVEKRQREPAKLLMPTSGGPKSAILPLKALAVSEDRLILPTKKGDTIQSGKSTSVRKSRPPQPILLIPRSMLPWGSAPVSYALWMQRDSAPPKGVIRREPAKKPPQLEPSTTSARARSGSVTRSGSLTSQGSSSSESGNETFPKSVLKKQKRNAANTQSKGSNNTNRKLEQKKNVTFNAFATVQLMEE